MMKCLGWIAAAAIAVPLGAGCESSDREVELQEFQRTDPRRNREGAPPTGLKRNPARPKTYHPKTDPQTEP